ncbi:MAG: spondin domain-containing protein [Aureliella sp.]
MKKLARKLRKKFENRRRTQRSIRSTFGLRCEALEDRKLLAAAILEGDSLTILGSDQADTIHVSSVAAGVVQVEVAEGDRIELNPEAQVSNGLTLSEDGRRLEVRTSAAGGAEGEIINTIFGPIDTVNTITIVGGEGDDDLSARGVTESVLILGGGGNDTIVGGEAGDLIDGGDGDDFIDARGGDDNVVGNAGNDVILGGLGNDRLVGGFGADEISGGQGDDHVIGDGQIEVKVTNLQTADGLLVTPVFLATQDGVYDFVDAGSPASPSLERLAEDGATQPRIDAAFASGGVRHAVATPGGPIAPGESRVVTLFADPSDPNSRYLSYATMVIPSNDAFVANDDPVEIDLFDGDELIRRVGDSAFVVLGDDVYDAGTEVNDEIPENTAALAQAAPNTGVTENGVVRQHPGFQGSARLGGPIGNILDARPDGDFTVPGSQILSIEVDEARQQSGFGLSVVDQPFASLTTAQTQDELLAEAVDGNLYFNVHTQSVGSGEIRGQLTLESDETEAGVRTIELSANLDSAQEPGGTSDSTAIGTGSVVIVVEGGVATYSVGLDIEGILVADLLPVAGISAIHIHNAPAGTNGPVITDVVQDAGGDAAGNATSDESDTGDGNVFVETFVSADDVLRGGAGNDVLVGGLGDDLLAGGGGQDTIIGGEGNDTNSFEDIGLGVTATVAADGTGTASYGGVNESFTGIENLTGSAQNDVLVATGAAANILIGGAGDDILAGGGGLDVIDGGEGSDTNSFAGIGLGVTAVINDDATGTASYGSIVETFTSIENLVGSDNDDSLTGNNSANRIDGGLGADVIVGLGGDDFLFGNSGDDEILGGDGDDRLVGGFGADQITGGLGDDHLIGAGQITVTLTNLQETDGALLTPIVVATQNGVYDQIDIGSPASPNIERLAEDGTIGPRIEAALNSGGVGEAVATPGGPLAPGDVRVLTLFADPSDPLTQYLSWASMVIPSNDAFIANDSPLELDLFNGTSLIRRTSADAFIVTGNDVLDAGTEVNDEIPRNTAALAQTAPNTGTFEGGVIRQHPGFQGSERLGGAQGNILAARPNADFTRAGSNILRIEIDAPEDGDDLLVGGLGNDLISGGEGNDTLIGDAGDDRLIGGDGDDRLVGGFGNDDLDGGNGNDHLLGGGQIEVKVTNLQPEDGSLLTPVFLATQNGVYDQFDAGSPASESIERLAEDGITGPRIEAALNSGGVADARATDGGPIAPGQSRTITLFADPADPLSQYLSYASMVIPSNDAFVGNDDPLALDLFDNGELIQRLGDDAHIVLGSQVWDAGTEVNDEVPENTAALAQAAPNTGVTENGVIRLHEGFQGSLALGGPIGNILTARPGADFTLPGAQILSIEIGGTIDGDDYLRGGAGNDTLSGGEGDDILAGGGGSDTILGGAGNDTNSFEGIGLGVTATVAADGTGTAAYGGVTENFTGIENLTGSDHDDVLTATGPAANILIGGAGDDILAGGPGLDTIDGGEGNDTNSFAGISQSVTATINGDGTGTASYGSITETFTSIENLLGSDGDDNLVGNDGDNRIDGGLGNDTIDGGGGNDFLFGNSGDDTLIGGNGDDRLVGGFGADNLSGGAGNDHLIGAGQITVTVRNLQQADGALLTPVVVATQNGVYDQIDIGSPASENIERLAEDGSVGPRIAAALGSGGVGDAQATSGGPLLPGDARTLTFFADPSDPLTQYLSWASMVIPSNDAFIANDSPLELDLFDGTSLIRRRGDSAFIVTGDHVLDAGTEVNDEIPENTAALAQAAPNTGETENGVIRQHPGFQGSERLGGPIGNILTARPGADFTVPGSNILSIEVDGIVGETFTVSHADQPLTSLTTAQTPSELVAEALAGNLYYNIHTINVPRGEIRGQLNVESDLTDGSGLRTIVLLASLDSAQEPNDTSDSEATGRGRVTIIVDGADVTYSSELTVDGIRVENLLPVAGISPIHIHNAPAGTNGPVITDIVRDAGGDNNGNLPGGGDVFNQVVDDDVLLGGSGNDVLSGGAGNDLLAGGGGQDTIIGSDGFDTNSFADLGVGVVAEIEFEGTGTARYGSIEEEFTGIEALIGTDHNDVLRGDSGDNVLLGGGGSDVIEGFGGDDLIEGGDGDDQLSGGTGDDTIRGGAGNDVILGNDGADRAYGENGDDRIVGGGGTDFLNGGEGQDEIDALPDLDALRFFPLGALGETFNVPASEQVTGFAVTALEDTVLSISRSDGADADGVVVLDALFGQISLLESGDQVARLTAGQSFVVLFEASDEFATYQADSSAGQENVRLSVGNLTNPLFGPDANGDGFTTPLDALLIVNFLNVNATLRQAAVPQVDVPTLADVNGDRAVTPLDALLIINELNNRSGLSGSGEGEEGLAAPLSNLGFANPVRNRLRSQGSSELIASPNETGRQDKAGVHVEQLRERYSALAAAFFAGRSAEDNSDDERESLVDQAFADFEIDHI